MVETITQYRCGICRQLHSTFASASTCEARGVRTLPNDPQVGDIVLCGGYGWWRGDPEWVSFETGAVFHGVKLHRPKMVVVDRRMDESHFWHSIQYIMFTPSYCTGESQVLRTSPTHIPADIIGKATPEDLARYQEEAAKEMQEFSPRLA